LLAVLALPAQAQMPTEWPVIEADIYMHPVGGRVPMRFLAKQDGMEHEVQNGTFDIDYEITCQHGSCPSEKPRVLRRGNTTIPCGSSETGPVGFNLVDLPSSFPGSMGTGMTTFSLNITNIHYDKYDEPMVDDINRKYGHSYRRYNPDGTYWMVHWIPCKKVIYTGVLGMGVNKSASMNLN